MPIILGLDIGKDQVDAVLLQPEHEPEQSQFANTPTGFNKLWRFLKQRHARACHVCMEATGLYYEALADFLHAKGATVSVVNPARIKAYAASQLTRNKTDQLDARTIAAFCQTQNPPLWTPPSPEWRQLRALARHLDDLQGDLQRQKNRLHARLVASDPVTTVVEQLKSQINLLETQIQQVKQAMNDHIDQHPDLKQDRDLISSIPGLGTLTANKLLAEFQDMRLFDNVRQVVAFAGLNPRHHQSGSSVRGRTKISKMGRASIRALLYMPAVTAKRYNPILAAFATRLEQRGLSNQEIVVAVMRKLLHLVFGILKSRQPFDPNFLQTACQSA